MTESNSRPSPSFGKILPLMVSVDSTSRSVGCHVSKFDTFALLHKVMGLVGWQSSASRCNIPSLRASIFST